LGQKLARGGETVRLKKSSCIKGGKREGEQWGVYGVMEGLKKYNSSVTLLFSKGGGVCKGVKMGSGLSEGQCLGGGGGWWGVFAGLGWVGSGVWVVLGVP